MEKKVVRWKTAVTRLRRELAKDNCRLVISRNVDDSDLIINESGTVDQIDAVSYVKKHILKEWEVLEI
jgi:hypothetical protein